MDSPEHHDREPSPFLLKLFYRTGSFHRPDEFSSPHALPPHLTLHIYPFTTLLELSHHLLASLPPGTVVPNPAIGTRLSFRLIYPDTSSSVSRGLSSVDLPPRYLTKDLGSLVFGEGGPGMDLHNNGTGTTPEEEDVAMADGAEGSAASKSLSEVKFVTGDYLSVAVLPPDEGTGEVVPAAARVEVSRGSGTSVVSPMGRKGVNGGLPTGPAARGGWGRGGGGRFGGREWDDRGGRGRDRDGMDGPRLPPRFPEGEWRRGERLPDGGGGGRGRRDRGGRW